MTIFKITCQEVGCRYTIRQGHLFSGHHDALRDVTFNLTDGERLGIIGMNGAGKSTLLRLLAGVLHPTSGRIIREGNPNCSLLSLSNQWYPDLSGRDNAILACLLAGMRRSAAEARVETMREFSELGRWMDLPVRTYSTGMALRLALAAALQVQPDVLLLDETLGVGDAVFQQKAAAAIMDTVERARSLVLVSHDINSIISLCDRILWLEDGRVRADGPTEEIAASYAAWVAADREVRAVFSEMDGA
ncbi:ABC transporter (plasmid) [Deltaproteobacteria bacterium Smac51]|nr:ABC transporter [Deltaproteobacteria bacterium Smac51]